jgi:hypothetical protein
MQLSRTKTMLLREKRRSQEDAESSIPFLHVGNDAKRGNVLAVHSVHRKDLTARFQKLTTRHPSALIEAGSPINSPWAATIQTRVRTRDGPRYLRSYCSTALAGINGLVVGGMSSILCRRPMSCNCPKKLYDERGAARSVICWLCANGSSAHLGSRRKRC